MIKDFFAKDEIQQKVKDPTKGMMMVMLSISTSIPAVIIGITASAFTLLGMELGSKIGRFDKLRPFALLSGGIILLLIGFNILYEHGVFDFLVAKV